LQDNSEGQGTLHYNRSQCQSVSEKKWTKTAKQGLKIWSGCLEYEAITTAMAGQQTIKKNCK